MKTTSTSGRIDYSYGYSFSREKEPDRLDTNFDRREAVQIGYTDIGKQT